MYLEAIVMGSPHANGIRSVSDNSFYLHTFANLS